jgi:hypothetical protein
MKEANANAALKLALEALEESHPEAYCHVITAIKEALAKPEHDCTRSHPHEEMSKECELRTEIARLRNKLAQRTWVGLDPEEIRKTNHHMVDGAYHYSFKQGAEWAEAKLKEKNT